MGMLNDFLEKTLEDIIYNNRDVIHSRGLSKIKSNAYRQVILPSGKKIDILGFEIKSGVLCCDIYELKREVINADAICQAFNYYTELKFITKNFFSNIDAKIIMVGRKYEPVSIINALPVPIDVFTYEYYMDGIVFNEVSDRYTSFTPHESFSFGLWAFGHAGLCFNQERTSVSFHSVFEEYHREAPDFKNKIKGYINYYVVPKNLDLIEPQIIIEEKESDLVVTEIFPEQPQWSLEFAKSIPPAETLMEDLDFDDELEYDDSDYEPDSDFENEPMEADITPLISEIEYDKSLLVNSLSIQKILSHSEFREAQKYYYDLFRVNNAEVSFYYPLNQEWLHEIHYYSSDYQNKLN